MQRQRGELVPIGDALSDMAGPVQTIREATPQARHSFTVADQVNQIVSASEADADLGFMARTMALCSLPRSNPGNRLQYKRVNGPFTLYMIAGGGNKLPFGNLPRLILAWVSTEAVRTQSRELVLGKSLSDFMRSLGVYSSSGGKHTRLRNQMKRLFNAHVQLIYKDVRGEANVSSSVADRSEFWWNERKPDEPSLWESKIYLGEAFFNEIIQHPVPIDMNTLMALKRSPLGLDLYLWLTYRVFTLHASRSTAPLLAAGLSAVRSGPGQGQRQPYRSEFSPRLPTRVEKDPAGLAGVQLHHGSGPPDPSSLNSRDRTAQSRPAKELISPFPGLSAGRQRPRQAVLDLPRAPTSRIALSAKIA